MGGLPETAGEGGIGPENIGRTLTTQRGTTGDRRGRRTLSIGMRRHPAVKWVFESKLPG
jgi:hypothetical protein